MRRVTVAVSVASLAILYGCGSGEARDAYVVTKTDHIERTPEACLDALDISEDYRDQLTRGLVLAAAGIPAAREKDTDRLTQLSLRLSELERGLERLRGAYDQSAADCRNLGRAR